MFTYGANFLFSLYCCPQHTQHVAPQHNPAKHLAHSSSSSQQHGQHDDQHLARAPQHGAHGPQQSESGQHEAQHAQHPHTKQRTIKIARRRRRKMVATMTSHSHHGNVAAPVNGTTGAAVTVGITFCHFIINFEGFLLILISIILNKLKNITIQVYSYNFNLFIQF